MKLLTLNANSYCGKDPYKNMQNLLNVIANSDFDVIALQEVNQLISAVELPISELDNYIPCQDRVPLKEDNYVYQLAKSLKDSGQEWYYSWLPIHVGWDIYDEGLAIMTRHPIRKTNAFYVSKETKFTSIKTRMALGVQLTFNGKKEWFYSCHFDKWTDPIEPFSKQWDRFVARACNTPEPLYVMGDFNNDGNITGEAYDYILQTSNLVDTFREAEYKDNGITVGDYIAGWTDGDHPKEMRIDFIFTNTDQKIISSHVIFNNKNKPVVSDHYGIEVELGSPKKDNKYDIPEFSSDLSFAMPPSILIDEGKLTLIDPILRRRIVSDMEWEELAEILGESLQIIIEDDE